MMRCLRYAGSAAVLLAVLLVAVGPVRAAFEYHPYLILEEEYNDNINLTDEDEEDDWITTVQPGIRLGYDSRSLTATVDYSLRYRFYQENDEESLDEFEDVQRADATALFFEGRPFTLRVSEVISRETLDESDDNLYSETDRSTLYHLTVAPEYDWRLTPTLSLVLGYGYDRYDYAESAGNDSREHSGSATLLKMLSSSNDVYLRFVDIFHESDDEEDYERRDYILGVTYRLGGRTTIVLEGGYGDVEYDSGFEDDSTRWLADLSYSLSEVLTLSAIYSQDYALSAAEGLRELREASVGAIYRKESLSGSATLFWDNSDYIREDREDESAGLRLELSKPLARYTTLNLDGEYQRLWLDDPDADEDIDRFSVGTSLDYVYRRLTATLGYRFRINDSNLPGADYVNNIITLSGAIRF